MITEDREFMSEKSVLNSVNPHYLERVVDLSTNYDISVSEDIYDANGMKLLAKGAKRLWGAGKTDPPQTKKTAGKLSCFG
jgi:hypothetical protein